MTPDKVLLVIIFFVLPPITFLVMGISEFQAARAAGKKPWSLIPVGAALVDFGILLGPGLLMEPSFEWLNALSRTMVVVSLVIAGSGLYVRYSRRRNAILIGCGCLLLAFIWFFDRLVA